MILWFMLPFILVKRFNFQNKHRLKTRVYLEELNYTPFFYILIFQQISLEEGLLKNPKYCYNIENQTVKS